MNLTTKEKNDFLKQYLYGKERIAILLERKKAYQDSIYGIRSPKLDDMPHGHEPHGVDEAVIRCLAKTSEIDAEIIQLTKKMSFIKRLIESMENLKFKSILEMKYIDGMTYAQMTSIMECSMEKITQVRKKALNSLPLTDEYVKLYNNV